MPIYEFVCQECGVHYEHVQSFSAVSLPPCPACHSHHVARMLGRPAIHFKGSGWYITDSKKSDKKSALGGGEKTEKSEKSEAAGESAKKVETADDKGAKEATTAKTPAAET